MEIAQLTYEQAHQALPELIEVLWDAVDDGASVGFLPPLSTAEASEYWQEVFAAVKKGTTLLLVARDEAQHVLGTVQLALATKPNARHRAEAQKLLVPRRARHQGVGQALMTAVEAAAREKGRSLLVLDTRTGDPAEALYAKLGYHKVGTIPHYARGAKGDLEMTTLFYKPF